LHLVGYIKYYTAMHGSMNVKHIEVFDPVPQQRASSTTISY